MKFSVVIVFFIIAMANLAHAAISGYYKEVMQRGYAIDGDSVILPDSSKCSIHDFNNGLCGKEFFDLPYCVPEGRYVWDEEMCCEGLIAYLPEGVDGQETCRRKSSVDFSEIIKNPLLWLGILGFTGFVYASLLLVKKFFIGPSSTGK